MISNNDKIAISDITENKLIEVINYTKTRNVKIDLIGGWTDDTTDSNILNEKYKLQIHKNSIEFFSNYETQNNPITIIFISHIEKCETAIKEIITYENIQIKSFIIATLPTTVYKTALIKSISQKINAEAHFISIAKGVGVAKGGLYALLKSDEIIWTYKDLDIDVKNELIERNINSGIFLDVGAGQCTQSYNLAKMGFKVIATDISKDAIESAQSSIKDVEIEFLVDDILDTKINEEVDYIIDRGCFHCIEVTDRKKYVKSINKILKHNGILFLKAFDKSCPLHHGPTLTGKIDIIDLFSEGFKIEKIKNSFITDGTGHNNNAVFAIIRCIK